MAAVLVLVLVGCGQPGVPPGPMSFQTEIEELMEEWGGDEAEYERIFALRDCAQAEQRMRDAARAADAEPAGSDAQRAQSGYRAAAMSLRAHLGC